MGRQDKLMGRTDKPMGRPDKPMGRTDKLMGRTDKPMGHQPRKVFFKLRTGKNWFRHVRRGQAKSGKVQTCQEKLRKTGQCVKRKE
jgi:hypothetical protein